MKAKVVTLVVVLILTSCITPQPTVSPIITPTPFKSPLPIEQPATTTPLTQLAISNTLQNGNMEGEFVPVGNAVTVAKNWTAWWLNIPPCKPGTSGCDIPCPLNCNGCPTRDQGCYWAMPEYAAAYKPDYNPPRAHSGLWGQKTFCYGRECRYGLYQQVNITSTSILTFSIWYEGWQCFDSDHCSLQAVKNGGSPTDPPADPDRALFLMMQWGCTDYTKCKLWTASDRPYAMHMKVGIDPTGGISPTASTVVWGKEIESFDYWSQATVTTTKSSSGLVTVFTYASPMFDYSRTGGNDVYQDDATLEIQPLATPVYKVYLPVVRTK